MFCLFCANGLSPPYFYFERGASSDAGPNHLFGGPKIICEGTFQHILCFFRNHYAELRGAAHRGTRRPAASSPCKLTRRQHHLYLQRPDLCFYRRGCKRFPCLVYMKLKKSLNEGNTNRVCTSVSLGFECSAVVNKASSLD